MAKREGEFFRVARIFRLADYDFGVRVVIQFIAECRHTTFQNDAGKYVHVALQIVG